MLDYNEMVASMIILANAETFLVCVELGEIPLLCKLKELNQFIDDKSCPQLITAHPPKLQCNSISPEQ